MKKKALVIAILAGLFAIDSSYAEDGLSVGVGIGALYSGIGVNLGRRSENTFGYLAAGCGAISNVDGWKLPCGGGAGWIRTDLLTKTNNRHGLGIYVGPVGHNAVANGDWKARYGAGLTYVYFFGDVVARGWSIGVTPTVGKKYGDYRGGLLVDIGYQF